MKKFSVFTIAILFAVSGCNTDANKDKSEPVNYGSTLSIRDQQVWERNYTATKISQAYNEFKGSAELVVLGESGILKSSGSIINGNLNLTVNKPEPDQLLPWDEPFKPNLKLLFSIIAEGSGWNTKIDNPDTKGNLIEIATDANKVLIKEDVSGTNSSISNEMIFFIYVDRTCTITGDDKEIGPLAYTLNAFVLNLFEGWNTVCYKQTYTTLGKSTFSMEVKNPDLKWVLIPNLASTP